MQKTKIIRKHIHALWSLRIIRYGIGGGIAAVVDLFCLYMLTEFVGIWYLLSQLLAFIVSFAFGFWFQKQITFQKKDGNMMKQGKLFLLFQLGGICINLIILGVLVEFGGIHYLVGSIIAKGVVFAWNYVMNAKYNFK